MSRTPAAPIETLVSYGGEKVRTRVVTPTCRDELRAALAYARERGWSVTIRASGHAFDTQSLNREMVISLKNFSGVTVDEESETVTAGAGAQWGEILASSAKKGMVPYIMVTTHTATAGGTLSSNSLSRFSPTLGREGQHVERFVMMKPDGSVVECSRGENADLFRTVIAGLGYVGVVLEVTHRLLPLGLPASHMVVATTFEKIEGFAQIAARLLFHVRTAHKNEHRSATEAAKHARNNPMADAWAVSAVVYTQGGATGLIATSQYASAPPKKRRPSVFHSPNSIGAWLLQIAALFPVLRAIGYWFVIKQGFKSPENYVDEVAGYTFFEDCNRNLRQTLRAIGFPMGIRQQTYIVPIDPDDLDGSESALANFMVEAQALLNERGLSPTLIDVLYLPDDANDRFSLSSSRDIPGFAVTLTFEKLASSRFEQEELAMRAIVEKCLPPRGRVSLVKNVCADPADIERMYQEGIAEMKRVREANGAKGLLSNDFMVRVLPGLLGPGTGP